MHAHAMDARGRTARTLMACLGEASRFRLVRALLGGERCVTDLAAEVGLSQSCTTRHLQALERRQVVRGKRAGKRVLYELRRDQPALGPLLAWALRAEWEGAGREGARLATGAIVDARDPHGRRSRADVQPAGAVRPRKPARLAGSPGGPGPAPGAGTPDPITPAEPAPFARPRRSDIEDYLL